MLIRKEMKLADVIHHDHNLIPVINHFGIHLGFGDQTIGEICTKYEVNIEFFITIVNTFHDKQFFPRQHLQSFSAGMLVDYLRKTHQYYIAEKIPEIEGLIQKMTANAQGNEEPYLLAQNFFAEYKNELTAHIEREEERVYPYAISLEEAINAESLPEDLIRQMNTYPITEYEAEHEDVEEKLFDLKNIIIKYLPAPTNDQLSFHILNNLFMLEKDLNEHARIENLILIPKVEAMEFTLKNRVSNND
ncbi:MAG: hemerythrin domain-containing protein [Bacteroidales bacterium]|nr:hemerythrin domain-containing protein [Bacteroidales bacterium]